MLVESRCGCCWSAGTPSKVFPLERSCRYEILVEGVVVVAVVVVDSAYPCDLSFGKGLLGLGVVLRLGPHEGMTEGSVMQAKRSFSGHMLI